MGYSQEVIQAAKDELHRRHSAAANQAVKLRERIIALRPRICEIEQEMANSSMLIARAVLGGGNINNAVDKIKHRNLELQAELAAEIRAGGGTTVNFEPVYTCPKCDDTGYTHGKICQCYEKLLRDEACRRVSFTGMSTMRSAGFEALRLDYYSGDATPGGESPRTHMSDIFHYCRCYADDFDLNSPSLLFYGRTGTGKTHVSLAISRSAAQEGFSAVYSPVQILLHKLEKEHFGRETDRKTIDLLTECDLLVLDDLGSEFTSPFYVSCLYNLINSRMLEERPTIISTNLDQNGLFERYGEQITSRIIGSYIPLFFVGKDIRQLRMQESISLENRE